MKLMTLLVSTLFSLSAMAGDVEAGKAKSATCMACHGQKGISMIPMYPNLAGQKAQYLLLQLQAYKNGVRKNPVMTPMVQNLSETDMEDLAAYYASLSPCQDS